MNKPIFLCLILKGISFFTCLERHLLSNYSFFNFDFYIEEYCSIYVLYCGYVCLCKRLGSLNFGSLNIKPLPKFIYTVQCVRLLNKQLHILYSLVLNGWIYCTVYYDYNCIQKTGSTGYTGYTPATDISSFLTSTTKDTWISLLLFYHQYFDTYSCKTTNIQQIRNSASEWIRLS